MNATASFSMRKPECAVSRFDILAGTGRVPRSAGVGGKAEDSCECLSGLLGPNGQCGMSACGLCVSGDRRTW